MGHKAESFRLLDLPPELRLRIHELVVQEDARPADRCNNRCLGVRPVSYLTLVSRLIHDEVSPLWYSLHSIRLRLSPTFPDKYSRTWQWLEAWEQTTASMFRHITLEDYQQWDSRHRAWCFSSIRMDLKDEGQPVAYHRDEACQHCPGREEAIDRVNRVVLSMGRVNGRRCLTERVMEQILNAAARNVGGQS